MQIGQLITVSVFLIDKKQLFDVKATNCYLYDRHDFHDSRKINLTNDEGCSTDTLLFDGFKKIDNGKIYMKNKIIRSNRLIICSKIF